MYGLESPQDRLGGTYAEGAGHPDKLTVHSPLTVKHILMECVDFTDVRNKHFVALLVMTYLKMSKHRTSLILLKKLIYISNFNVFILMFVIYFLF